MKLSDLILNPELAEKLPTPKLLDLLEKLRGTALSDKDRRTRWPTVADMAEELSQKNREKWLRAPHLDLMSDNLADIASGKLRRLMVSMPPRHGKQIDDSVPVLTTKGFKPHGKLLPGDFVYSPSGEAIEVLAVSSPSSEKVLVEFTDGSSIKCHPNHEWQVYDRACGEVVVMETRVIAEQALWSGDRARFQLQPTAALKGELLTAPVDPYTLGVWLGDGTKGVARVCGTREDIEHYKAKIPYALGYEYVHPGTGVVYQYFKGLSSGLRLCGVFTEKRIPELYYLLREDKRRALLAGLVDTDGHVGPEGRTRFLSVSKDLAGDVLTLVRTLGYKVTMRVRAVSARNRKIKDKLPVWEVDWTPMDGLPQGSLPRKLTTRTGKLRRVGIRAITKANLSPGRCIQVASPDGLYLVGRELIPTHNSELISFWFPIWLFHRDPGTRIILCSYAADLAAGWGRRVRDFLIEHGEELGVNVKRNTRAAYRWETEEGGFMITAGVGGPIVGRGAHVMIVDDVVKDAEEANSEVMREKTMEWWQGTAIHRLEPGGSVVFVATRWHYDDLLGRLEDASNRGSGQKFEIIKLPALAESEDPIGRQEGEALWPLRYDESALAEIKTGMTPFGWSALFQQRPTPEEGGVIKTSWWRYYTPGREPQDFDQVIMSWDLAFKDLQKSDFTVGQVWGRKGANYFLLYQVRERLDAPGVIDRIRHLAGLYPQARAKLIEDAANGPAVFQMLRNEVPGMILQKAKGSKDARLSAVAPLIQAGNVFIPDPKGADWVNDFILELSAFPMGTNDDQVDALSQALNYMARSGRTYSREKWDETLNKPPAQTVQEMYNQDFSSWIKKRRERHERQINDQQPVALQTIVGRTGNW